MRRMGTGRKELSWLSYLLCPEQNRGVQTAHAEGLILMDAGRVGLDWRVDERSRARAATGLGNDGAEQDGGGECGQGIERGMTGRASAAASACESEVHPDRRRHVARVPGVVQVDNLVGHPPEAPGVTGQVRRDSGSNWRVR